MQAVYQVPQIGQRRSRRQWPPGAECGAPDRIGHPGRESTNGPIGEFAIDVLSTRELSTPTDAQVLPMKRVERVVNLDDIRTMGIMFWARLAREKVTC
jgi:hypothetical protein